MPIQFKPEDNNKWTIAPAVNKVQSALTIDKESDGFWTITAKRVSVIPANTALLLAAFAETIIKATMVALSALLYPITDAPLNEFKDSTKLAGRATAEAFKGIFGYSTPIEVKIETKIEPAAKGWGQLALENKGKIALFVLGATALCTAVYFRKDILSVFAKEDTRWKLFLNKPPEFYLNPTPVELNPYEKSLIIEQNKKIMGEITRIRENIELTLDYIQKGYWPELGQQNITQLRIDWLKQYGLE